MPNNFPFPETHEKNILKEVYDGFFFINDEVNKKALIIFQTWLSQQKNKKYWTLSSDFSVLGTSKQNLPRALVFTLIPSETEFAEDYIDTSKKSLPKDYKKSQKLSVDGQNWIGNPAHFHFIIRLNGDRSLFFKAKDDPNGKSPKDTTIQLIEKMLLEAQTKSIKPELNPKISSALEKLKSNSANIKLFWDINFYAAYTTCILKLLLDNFKVINPPINIRNISLIPDEDDMFTSFGEIAVLTLMGELSDYILNDNGFNKNILTNFFYPNREEKDNPQFKEWKEKNDCLIRCADWLATPMTKVTIGHGTNKLSPTVNKKDKAVYNALINSHNWLFFDIKIEGELTVKSFIFPPCCEINKRSNNHYTLVLS